MFLNIQGQPSNGLRDGKGFSEVHSRSSFQSGGSTMLGRFNRSDLYSPNTAAQTR